MRFEGRSKVELCFHCICWFLAGGGGVCLFVLDKHGHDDIGLLCGDISRGLSVTLSTSQVLGAKV